MDDIVFFLGVVGPGGAIAQVGQDGGPKGVARHRGEHAVAQVHRVSVVGLTGEHQGGRQVKGFEKLIVGVEVQAA